MKLLQKTTRYFLIVSMAVFLLGGVLFYLLFQAIIDNDLVNKLQERKKYVLKQLEHSDSLLLYQNYSANTLSITASDKIPEQDEILSDTGIFDPIDGKLILYRQLTFSASHKGKQYSAQIRRTLVERKDLIKGVVILEALLFLAFVATLTILNNKLSKRLWKPFYDILDSLNGYHLEKSETLTLKRTSVTEFNELALSIEKMTSKIHQEFSMQKEFIENASHETQTPLAIIKNEMEVLLQSPELSEKQIQSISSATMAANRLSKVNEALLILSRIENRQFHVIEDICINDLIDRHLEHFEELTQMKDIKVRKCFKDRIGIKMNPFLADMLVENLVTNAIKHNVTPGMIMIYTEGHEITISNTGEQPRQDPDKFFERFVRANPQSSSLGLGLAIVKAICETYMLPIKYSYEDNLHRIRIDFNNMTERA